ncbi:MAG: putative type II secretion system protein K [Syntrophorhabdus sp. PtaU1.Bin002]|nr:MAG: putative type II secretion system protein K [Syntrophorhabdus sp. PtaU1.Bin002]
MHGRMTMTMKQGKALFSNRGIALLVVLWILTILIVIVLSFAFMARTEVYSTITFREGVEKKFVAEAAIERGIVELYYRFANKNQTMAVEGSEIVRIDGRLYRGGVGGSWYSFAITDESGKISINTLTDANGVILNNLLVNMGISGDDANTIVDSILDWEDSDNLRRLHGAEDEYYLSLPIPYRAKNGRFDTIEELLLVKGMTTDILFGSGSRPGLIGFLTIYTDSPIINVNAAPREVLMALPDITATMADRIIEAREEMSLKGPQDIAGIIGDVLGRVTGYIGFEDANVYTIEGKGFGKDEKRGFTVRAIVAIEGGNRYRYVYYKSPADTRQ